MYNPPFLYPFLGITRIGRHQLGFDPKAVLAAIVIASSLAYATPIGMPANTMVYNIAGYSFMDYVKAGLPLIVVSSIVALVLLPILFPF